MSTLFKRIYYLLSSKVRNQQEDYFTEIFAEVFEKEGLLQDFLYQLTTINVASTNIHEITTQKTYGKQIDHVTDSRPDMMIRFAEGKQSHIIFIENKLGTGEGDQQLKRYADHLRNYEADGCRTHLIYITKAYDPKRETDILQNGNQATFHQIRWFQVYNWLQTQRSELIDMILEYMEEIGLNDSRRFLPQDIYAIQNMERIVRMMDACLDGPVEHTITKLFNRSTSWTNRFVQLKEEYRYMKQNDQGNFSAINYGFHQSEEDYPIISIMFQVNPKCPNRPAFIKAMKSFLEKNEGWSSQDIDDHTAWSMIHYDKSLLQFLSTDDHIESIQAFFIERLKELYKLKQQTPELEWKSKGSGAAD